MPSRLSCDRSTLSLTRQSERLPPAWSHGCTIASAANLKAAADDQLGDGIEPLRMSGCQQQACTLQLGDASNFLEYLKKYLLFTLVRASGNRCLEHVDTTLVQFRTLSRAEVRRYIEIEHPLDCAGGFKCEGLGIALFESIDSRDPTALIGLPMIWVAEALRRVGMDPLG